MLVIECPYTTLETLIANLGYSRGVRNSVNQLSGAHCPLAQIFDSTDVSRSNMVQAQF